MLHGRHDNSTAQTDIKEKLNLRILAICDGNPLVTGRVP